MGLRIAMDVTLSADLERRVGKELANGQYRDLNQLIEDAVGYFLEQRQRGERRLDALRRIGQAVDARGLYERVLAPDQD